MSVMLPSTSVTRGSASAASRFRRVPRTKLSKTTTFSTGSNSRRSTMCEPTNPAPPMTAIRAPSSFMRPSSPARPFRQQPEPRATPPLGRKKPRVCVGKCVSRPDRDTFCTSTTAARSTQSTSRRSWRDAGPRRPRTSRGNSVAVTSNWIDHRPGVSSGRRVVPRPRRTSRPHACHRASTDQPR